MSQFYIKLLYRSASQGIAARCGLDEYAPADCSTYSPPLNKPGAASTRFTAKCCR